MLHSGRPTSKYDRGGYAEPHILSDHLDIWLSHQVSQRLGQAMTVHLVHDGTAAAKACAEVPHAAVITLGTAIGVGFAAGAIGLRPIADHFRVSQAEEV